MNAQRWFGLVLVPLSACAWWMAGRPSLTTLDRLIFSHGLHVGKEEVECSECHDGVDQATSLDASYLPKEDTCLGCHDKEDNCQQCHTNAAQRAVRPPKHTTLAFSHKQHLDLVEGKCTACHTDANSSIELPVSLPSMDACLTCHEMQQAYAEGRCNLCHTTLRSAPPAAVAELRHGTEWLSRHGLVAQSYGETCLQCHSQTTCSECHANIAPDTPARLYPEQTGRTLQHRGDFVATHAIEARAEGETCLRCHTSSTCVTCHEAYGKTSSGTFTELQHPPGYAYRGGAAFHGDDARLRIETCVACHDQGAASNCVSCHSVGGIGGNPHPPGWSSRYDSNDNTGMCRTCHSAP